MPTQFSFRSEMTQDGVQQTLTSQLPQDAVENSSEPVAVQSQNAPAREVKQPSASFMDNAHITSMISVTGGLALLIGSLWLFFQAWKIFSKGKANGPVDDELCLNALKSVPCYKCTYFSDNVYIKCAVHPETVLTSRAHHCPDYCSRAEQFKKGQQKGLWGRFF